MYVITRYFQGTVYTNDMMEVVEAAKQGVTVGEDAVPRSVFGDGFVGISEKPEGLQKYIAKALEYAVGGGVVVVVVFVVFIVVFIVVAVVLTLTRIIKFVVT